MWADRRPDDDVNRAARPSASLFYFFRHVMRVRAVLPESGSLAARESEPAAVRDEGSAGLKLAGGDVP